MKGGNPALGIETEELSRDWHAMSRGVGSRVCKELWSAGGPDGPVANMLEGQLLGVLKLLCVPSWKSPSLAQPDRRVTLLGDSPQSPLNLSALPCQVSKSQCKPFFQWAMVS